MADGARVSCFGFYPGRGDWGQGISVPGELELFRARRFRGVTSGDVPQFRLRAWNFAEFGDERV